MIGGDKLGQLTSQPPDRVYWTALRQWGLLLPSVGSRSEALRRLQASTRAAPLDDDGGALDDDSTEVFCTLPKPPAGWDDPEGKLDFKLSAKEQDFLRRQLGQLTRPGETAPCAPRAPRRGPRLLSRGGARPAARIGRPRRCRGQAGARYREGCG